MAVFYDFRVDLNFRQIIKLKIFPGCLKKMDDSRGVSGKFFFEPKIFGKIDKWKFSFRSSPYQED